MRSQSALEELLLNSTQKDKIEIKDFGLHNPVYDNSTWEGKLKNRRVDIFLWPLALWINITFLGVDSKKALKNLNSN